MSVHGSMSLPIEQQVDVHVSTALPIEQQMKEHVNLLIAALAVCISSYRFELRVPIERHWLGMHIMIWSLKGALPLYNMRVEL